MASTQEYANLSEHVYERNVAVGVRSPGRRDQVTIEGKKYEIYEHASNPATGYQGTVYRDKSSGEFIVAHRGTESPSVDKMDAIADVTMVNSRTNIQAQDALALTARAQAFANKEKIAHPDLATPTVSVTGHSLGGTLAQITSHHYGLRGEAFNPYGAVALDRRIPQGQGNFTNHVIAGDVVSAGAAHYGKTLVHATKQDVEAIQVHQYTRLLPGATVATAAKLMGDHSITNFTGHDGHVNILTDPQAGLRATQNWAAIQTYRDDVSLDRKLLGTVLVTPQGIKNVFNDVFSENTPSTPIAPSNSNIDSVPTHIKNAEYALTADLSSKSPESAKAISKHSSVDEMFDALWVATVNKDDVAARAVGHAYIQTDEGKAFVELGRDYNQQVKLQEQQALAKQVAVDQPTRSGPSMSV